MRDANILGSNKTHGSRGLIFTRLFVRTSSKRAIILAAALVCASLIAAPTSGDKIKRTVPLSAAAWTVDLRPYGYVGGREGHQTPRLIIFHTAAYFTNQGQIIATFMSHDLVPGVQRRDDPHRAYPFNLHAIVFEAASGRMLRQASWGSDYRYLGLIPREDGGFAVFLGDRLVYYTADLSLRGELKLPPMPEGSTVLWFSSSPTGRTQLIQYRNEENTCVWIREDAIFRQEQKCEFPVGAVISDQEIATITGTSVFLGEGESAVVSGFDEDAEVRIKSFDGSWRILCRGQKFHCGTPEFVAEDLLLLGGDNLVRNDGKTIFWTVGADGPTAFVSSYRAKSHLLAFPRYERRRLTFANLYDAFTGKRLFQVKNEGSGSGFELEGLAVSDDGRFLGVQSDGILRLFVLPQP